MSERIPAFRLADVAQQVLNDNPNMPYAKGGTTLQRGMDSGGFIYYCLKQAGVPARKVATNTLYRQLRSGAIPLKDALKQGKLVRGTILFRVNPSGKEPVELRNDGIGDADYAGICIDTKHIVYPSEQRGQLIKQTIELVSGKANTVVFHPALDYGAGASPGTPRPPIAPANPHREILKQMIVIGNGNLRLRKSADPKGAYIIGMKPGSVVDVHEFKGDWARVTYHGAGSPKSGWAMVKFLQDHRASNA